MPQPPVHSLWERLNNSVLVRFLLLFASGWAIVQLLAYFQIVVVVFASATVLAFLLSHPVSLCRRIMPHGLAVFVVFMLGLVFMGGLLGVVGIAVVSQGPELTNSIAEFLNQLSPLVDRLETTLQQWNVQVDLRGLEDQFKEQTLGLMGAGFGLLQALLANFITAILIAVVTFFMLMDGDRIWKFVIKRLPPHRRHQLTVTIRKNLVGFFLGRALLSTFFATATFIALLLLKTPYALTLALIGGLFDLIPGIGATLGICLICLLLLPQSLGLSFAVLISCVLIQQVEENILMPRIIGNSLNINPVVIFFALIVGARVAGLLGIFLSIPVAGVIVSLLEIDEMKGRTSLEAVKISPSDTMPRS